MIVFIKKEIGTEVSNMEGVVVFKEEGEVIALDRADYSLATTGDDSFSFHELEDLIKLKDSNTEVKTIVL